MSRHIAVGIDVGTYQIKVVVGEYHSGKNGSGPRILGTGSSESRGIRHGYIINQNDAIRSIKTAVRDAEKASGIEIKSAYLAVGGVSLESTVTTGRVIISRGDDEISELDVEHAMQASESSIPQSISLNKKILHAIPIRYHLDGHEILGRPIGMKGVKLEIETLYILCLEQHLEDLIDAIESIGIEVTDVMAAPLSASLVTLSKTQKIAGCVLANIGAETVSIIVYENNVPISLQTFPIGSTDITNDIALGLKIPLEDAERVKLGIGNHASSVPKKKLDEIIVARLSDIFELIEAHLKKINRNGLLPAGIIITGGGSGITTVEDLARALLRLPSKIGEMRVVGNGKQAGISDSTWAVAYGLCIYGFTQERATSPVRALTGLRKRIASLIRHILP